MFYKEYFKVLKETVQLKIEEKLGLQFGRAVDRPVGGSGTEV